MIDIIILISIIAALLFLGKSFFSSLKKEDVCDFNNHQWEAWTCQCALDAPRQKMIICKNCGKAYIHTPGISIVRECMGVNQRVDIERLWAQADKPDSLKIGDEYLMFYDTDVNPESEFKKLIEI